MRRLIAILACAMLLLVLLTPAALAEGEAPATPAAPAAKPATISLNAVAGQKGAVVLTATLKDGDGKPLSDQNVQFFVQADLFVKRPALIGEGTTDTTGSVAVSYVPTWTGTNQFQASYAGAAEDEPVIGQTTFAVSQLQVTKPAEPEEIPLVRQGTALLAVIATAAVWILMITVVFRVGFGVKHGAAGTAGATTGLAAGEVASARHG